jgi:hypothetical protein
MVKCANRNCCCDMAPDYFNIHLSCNKKMKYEKTNYEKILDCFIKTELFCISCCINHANITCSNSNIQLKEYFYNKLRKKDIN